MKERDIENYARKRVKAMGGEIRKVKWIGRRNAPDDLIMLPMRKHPSCLPGEWLKEETIWAEFKRPGETPTTGQAREHERMRRLGQRVEVIDSLARVDEVLS